LILDTTNKLKRFSSIAELQLAIFPRLTIPEGHKSVNHSHRFASYQLAFQKQLYLY
tara:strand:- start:721 stop:888 length:168 start_codon:yes stop_codon:yes gene_type:complete